MNQQDDTPPFILPFTEVTAGNLAAVGGKGANLGEMTRAGFPVPPGFCVTTTAFRYFMNHSEIAESIYADLAALQTDDLEAVRQVGEKVRQRLTAVTIPAEIAGAIITAWQRQGEDNSYAVRSSATAEDLPDASFAGQQDTFLNICGQEALLTAVRQCWVSLFTDRAILYRMKNGFAHEEVALSVVVQQMVLPEISGILFTADPVTGNRYIVSIDASYGLGEALVAGIVSADLYKIDKRTMKVVEIAVADKKVAIRPLPGGGTKKETITGEARTAQVLNEQQIIQLAQLGQKLEAHYNQPQDIEWAIAGGEIFALQTRPITSLFPIPTRPDQSDRLRLFFSFAAVQGVLDPMTPLGQETIKGVFSGAATLFGLKSTPATQPVIWSAAERLWGNMTGIITHPIGRRLLLAAFPMVEPGAAAAVQPLLTKPELQPKGGWFRWRTARALAYFLLPVMARFIKGMLQPDAQRDKAQQLIQRKIAEFRQKQASAQTFSAQLDFYETVTAETFPTAIGHFVPIIAVGMSSLKLLERVTRSLPPGSPSVLELTRGLPHNPTTEMDLTLWQTAQKIQSDPEARRIFMQLDAGQLAAKYLNEQLPEGGQTAVAQFLQMYGVRGLAEIDIGRKRWREDPTPVLQVLQSYLQITDPAQAPDAVFKRGEVVANETAALLATAVRQTHGGRLKARMVKFGTRRLRALAGLRETPKFFIIQLFGMAREMLLSSGAAFVADGLLAQEDDLFFLNLEELRQLAQNEPHDWRAIIAERRQQFAREQKRQRLPRLILSDGRVFYQESPVSTSDADGILQGSPVSPGVVEGKVHVVHSPYETQLAPGEILVCQGTDPAWTPLFLAAGGLVMEVGGLMTHGSVVAREYGIPAVVGVADVTQKLKTGQLIRVHGDSGLIELLADD